MLHLRNILIQGPQGQHGVPGTVEEMLSLYDRQKCRKEMNMLNLQTDLTEVRQPQPTILKKLG
jgi:hypothetical protein